MVKLIAYSNKKYAKNSFAVSEFATSNMMQLIKQISGGEAHLFMHVFIQLFSFSVQLLFFISSMFARTFHFRVGAN